MGSVKADLVKGRIVQAHAGDDPVTEGQSLEMGMFDHPPGRKSGIDPVLAHGGTRAPNGSGCGRGGKACDQTQQRNKVCFLGRHGRSCLQIVCPL
ncbi:hypothetical protein JCM14469_07040 [Desulfatiferula olefinivorans]